MDESAWVTCPISILSRLHYYCIPSDLKSIYAEGRPISSGGILTLVASGELLVKFEFLDLHGIEMTRRDYVTVNSSRSVLRDYFVSSTEESLRLPCARRFLDNFHWLQGQIQTRSNFSAGMTSAWRNSLTKRKPQRFTNSISLL